MIPAGQNLIRTSELAVELGVSDDTVCRWAKGKLRPARWSRGRFLVQKLRDMALLPRTETAAPKLMAKEPACATAS